MSTGVAPQKTVVVGAGPAGGLAAILAARRGDDVEVYDLRPDPRNPASHISTKSMSINLALSERGLKAIQQTCDPELYTRVLGITVPMFGRMIHGKKNGRFTSQIQQYDVNGRFQRAIDRGELSRCLLESLVLLPNVKVFFHHKLVSADFNNQKAFFQVTDHKDGQHQCEKEVQFDFLIGADGAYSATRYNLMRHVKMVYQQEYIDSVWCEFMIPSNEKRKDIDKATKELSRNHFHIWPSQDHLFIAIPNYDGSFTATLFMPGGTFKSLDGVNTASKLVPFFQTHYPGVVPDLLSEDDLIRQYTNNPHSSLLSIQCAPYHYQSRVVILGDAAHAMPPFYGQGMNAALEDVRILDSFLTKHMGTRFWVSDLHRDTARKAALEEYSAFRHPDAVAIGQLSSENYQQMSSHVTKAGYKLRKRIEEWLSAYAPWMQWETQYARVSFGNMRYSLVRELDIKQSQTLKTVGMSSAVLTAIGVVTLLLKLKVARPARQSTGLVLIWLADRLTRASHLLST